MTAVRQVYIRCDGKMGTCNEALGEFARDTVLQARKLARVLGWSRRDRRDLCPRCAREGAG